MTRKLGRLVVSVLAAAVLQALVVGDSAVAASTSRPSQRSTTKSTAKSTPRSAAKPTSMSSPITFSITSRIRHGKLVVSLDGVPVFNEEFQKPVFVITQTTSWDPVQVPAGKHKLTAKVYGQKGKTYASGTYDLVLSRTKGIDLHIRMKGDGLTVEPAS